MGYSDLMDGEGEPDSRSGGAGPRPVAAVPAAAQLEELRGRVAAAVRRNCPSWMREQVEGSASRAGARIGRLAARMPVIGIKTATRKHINDYWSQTYERLRRGSLLRINPFKVSFYLLRDVKLCFWFNMAFLMAYTK